MVPRALSYVKPNQSILWQGSHIDFSSLNLPYQDPFYCFRYATTLLAISLCGLAIVKKNSNALMSPMFFQRLKSFGEIVRCGR